MPGVSREQANKSALTAAELPKLGQNDTDIRQIAQVENNE